MMRVTIHLINGVVTVLPDVIAINEMIGQIRFMRLNRAAEEVFQLGAIDYFMVQPMGYMRNKSINRRTEGEPDYELP